jgi:hypothetical protein
MPYPIGSIQVTGQLGVTAAGDTYATHQDTLGKGGHQAVADATARDAVTADRRNFGMFVVLQSNGKVYKLCNLAMGGADNVLTNNANWIEFATGGGTVSSAGMTVGYVPYASAAQVLSNSNLRYDSVNQTFGINIAPSNTSFLTIDGNNGLASIVLSTSDLHSYSEMILSSDSAINNIRSNGSLVSGTMLGLQTANAQDWQIVCFDPSVAFRLFTINLFDASVNPLYIGQVSTTEDSWGISLDSGRVSNFQYSHGGGSTEHTISRFTKKRGDDVYSIYDKGIIEFCLEGMAGGPIAFVRNRWTYEVDTNEIGKWNIDVATGATPGTVFKSVIQNTTTKIIINNDSWFQEVQIIATVGGAAFIYVKGAGDLDISAAINYDIKLDNSGTGRVNFNGTAYVSTTLLATGYLPIKINGTPYKMLVSL